ncbi:class I SAM-dependent DNA methyltransferase [Marinitenerispora sediminis]|uniref:SAM-dependent methyltransferase n=1 Tax=Marinitenerispora sediminis TaxID=1931232 RepID=A0A368SYV8_9ACTN|nr:class I SAM-dependent methyltransferase [Marinitenerispora sediminis]RCV47764.1 SAM-dependent methyltransferase [Marinitenerispora sediminis]RCV48321.1 SAM-dependent methyltransferase [Marinitenerispora sediminis]RCV50079.1 SAM-dependent methyltransferase [Marinitenerispora sediminis]
MYGAELAEIYELVHRGRGKNYATETTEVAKHVWARKPDAASLLDVACGTGGHLAFFAELFDDVEGLDMSEAMLAVARRRRAARTLHHGDMRTFALDRRFDAITCMFGSIGYLASAAELDAALARFAGHLVPGGVVAIDPWWFPETFIEGYVSADVVTVDERTVARVSHSRREGDASRMHVHYVVADARSGARHFTETHLISLFPRAGYEAAFRRAGLTVDYIGGVQSGRGLFVGQRD